MSEPTTSKPLSPTPQPCTAGDLDQTAPANKPDCHEVSEVSVKPQDRAVGGFDLPLGPAQKPRFLGVQEVLNILRNTCSSPDIPQYVPRGSKEDQYFVVNNSGNCDRRKRGLQSQFWDDCGEWLSGPSNNTTFHCDAQQKLKKVVLRDGMYCLERTKDRKTVFSPLEPQPNADSILTVKRYYAKHTDYCAYEKKRHLAGSCTP